MKIRFLDPVMLELETIGANTRGLEFSGFGFVETTKRGFYVYDFVLLHVGSEVFTDIPASEVIKLQNRTDAKNMRLWVHRHPVGDGIPGPHNWSGTDNNTIKHTPLGGIPELVKWSLSAVRTPRGWVGRVDNHRNKTTNHVDVVPQISPILFDKVEDLYKKRYQKSRKKARRVIEPTVEDDEWNALFDDRLEDLFHERYDDDDYYDDWYMNNQSKRLERTGKRVHELTDREWQYLLLGDPALLEGDE